MTTWSWYWGKETGRILWINLQGEVHLVCPLHAVFFEHWTNQGCSSSDKLIYTWSESVLWIQSFLLPLLLICLSNWLFSGWWWCLLGQHLYNIYHFYKTIAIEKFLVCHLSTNETLPLLLVGNCFLLMRNRLERLANLGRKKNNFMYFFQVPVIPFELTK